MNTDYRALCIELFGTDDVAKLQMIAQEVKKKNPRNAGRKRKFSEEEIRDIRRMNAEGMTLNAIAEQFSTSRQIVSKYLNEEPEPGYTLRMTYMCRRRPCTVIDVNFLNRRIKINNRTADPLHRAFGVIEEPEWEDFEYFLAERCFPAGRGNVKTLLKALELTHYDPLQIIEKTGGRMADDDMWIKFNYYPMEVRMHG